MLKLLKYLKKSAFSMVIIVALLVAQAMCDLALPDYTSKIVNVGIQQGGIEYAVPEVVRESTMEKLELFIPSSDQELVKNSYTLLERETLSEKEYGSYQEKYPLLESEPLYVLKEDADIQTLEPVMSKALMAVSTLSGDSEDSQAIRDQMLSGMPSGSLPEGMDLFQLLAMMPQEQLDQMVQKMDETLSQMPESILQQSAIPAISQEYQAIGVDTGRLQTNYLLLSGAKMLGVAFLSMAAAIAVGFLASRVAASLGRELRGRVFHKVLSFSNTEMDHFSTASLITRSTNDIQQVQMMMVMLIRIVFYAPIVGIGGVIKVLGTNTSMAWVLAVAVMAILSLVGVLFAVAMPKFKIMQTLVDRLNLVAREILTGLSVIRAFHTEKHEEERFDGANRNLTRNQLFVNRVMTFMMPTMMLVMNGISILVVWVGSHGVDNGTMQVGDMMAFIQYTMQIIMSFLMISLISVMLPRASVAAGRIEEVIATPLAIEDPQEAQQADPSQRGVLEFRDVTFRYPGAEEDVLHHISFKALPGQTTAFIGSTGSGKSTLLNLIPRFYDVTEGQVLVDGVDVRQMTQHDLRAKLGYVPQKGVLFSGDIASNLGFGREDLSQEEMVRAAQIAQAEDFITAKPEGYEAPIAQGGTNVSGGQKQRLSIARAIAMNPEFYLFDDSFSALDYRTDVALRKALKEVTSESTVLIVAQRISTILHADQIIVLDEGRIVGRGTHEELMKNCEVYQQIALSQLSKEELGA